MRFLESPQALGPKVFLGLHLDGEHASAILCDEDGNAIYYGTVAAGTASGTQDMAMPADLAEGTYTLKVFSEQRNGDMKTDYAGDFVDIELTVGEVPDSPAPTVATLTFDLAGGTLDGKTGTVTVEANVGDTIKLPAALSAAALGSMLALAGCASRRKTLGK